ncbi:hypothetical protein IW148_004519 [Coemansia sp. RSA 1199]|nr:hypothetical protein IW148_004519 [Coemansia sp. RSA 1199]
MGNQLSFSYTEDWREEMAQRLGYRLDPRGKADWIMIIIITCVYSIDVIAVLFMLWNRKYPPLKCKSPVLMACMMVAGILWFVGDIQANGHAPLEHSPLHNCKAFGVWVRILLGVCTLSALIAMRSYGLFRVFRKNQPFRGWGLYVPYVAYCLCMLVYGIVSQVVSPKLTIHYMTLVDICYYETGFKASVFAIVWVTWLVVAVLSWRIRHIKSSFNEAREMLVACSAVFAVLIFTTVMHYAAPMFPLNVRLRVLTTSFDHFATNVFWWSIMAVPIMSCIVRRDAYLEEWMDKLRQDGLQRMYDVQSPNVTNNKGSSVYNRNSLFTADYSRLHTENPVPSPMDNGYQYFDPIFGAGAYPMAHTDVVLYPTTYIEEVPHHAAPRPKKKHHGDLW